MLLRPDDLELALEPNANPAGKTFEETGRWLLMCLIGQRGR